MNFAMILTLMVTCIRIIYDSSDNGIKVPLLFKFFWFILRVHPDGERNNGMEQ